MKPTLATLLLGLAIGSQAQNEAILRAKTIRDSGDNGVTYSKKAKHPKS
jgi:hypothetical protein